MPALCQLAQAKKKHCSTLLVCVGDSCLALTGRPICFYRAFILLTSLPAGSAFSRNRQWALQRLCKGSMASLASRSCALLANPGDKPFLHAASLGRPGMPGVRARRGGARPAALPFAGGPDDASWSGRSIGRGDSRPADEEACSGDGGGASGSGSGARPGGEGEGEGGNEPHAPRTDFVLPVKVRVTVGQLV